ncbi:MAG: PilN domain-containing protein [Cyanobacteria bacterium REEB459]|nr:PilN domain-containing protein [Cyanobacteria bacterium REEB459]
MYSLDINFLKDRDTRIFETRSRSQGGVNQADRSLLLYGLLGALLPLALVTGYWAFTRNQVSQLEAKNTELDGELAQIQSQLREIGGIQGQIDSIKAENNAFVAIFDQIVPWSALLQDIRDRTPAAIQITNLSQTAGVTPTPIANAPAASQTAAANAPAAPKLSGISIQGVACNFNAINDFTLVLQKSPLLAPASVAIDKAQQQTKALDPLVDGRCPGAVADVPGHLVDYTLRANLTSTPSSQLISALEQRGAMGLVTRLRALRSTGVLQ